MMNWTAFASCDELDITLWAGGKYWGKREKSLIPHITVLDNKARELE
jgi:hypothetical protein